MGIRSLDPPNLLVVVYSFHASTYVFTSALTSSAEWEYALRTTFVLLLPLVLSGSYLDLLASDRAGSYPHPLLKPTALLSVQRQPTNNLAWWDPQKNCLLKYSQTLWVGAIINGVGTSLELSYLLSEATPWLYFSFFDNPHPLLFTNL